MIVDYEDWKETKKVIGLCPKCKNQNIERIACKTDRGTQNLGIECCRCGNEFDEKDIIWKKEESKKVY